MFLFFMFMEFILINSNIFFRFFYLFDICFKSYNIGHYFFEFAVVYVRLSQYKNKVDNRFERGTPHLQKKIIMRTLSTVYLLKSWFQNSLVLSHSQNSRFKVSTSVLQKQHFVFQKFHILTVCCTELL